MDLCYIVIANHKLKEAQNSKYIATITFLVELHMLFDKINKSDSSKYIDRNKSKNSRVWHGQWPSQAKYVGLLTFIPIS